MRPSVDWRVSGMSGDPDARRTITGTGLLRAESGHDTELCLNRLALKLGTTYSHAGSRLGGRAIEAEEIKDHEWLSQYGSLVQLISDEPFKYCPAYGQDELSFIRGQVTLDEAARSVNRRKQHATVGDGVRYITAGSLRSAGFRVWHTPTVLNPDHVSVASLDGKAVWTEDEVRAFKACLKGAECEWKEGQL